VLCSLSFSQVQRVYITEHYFVSQPYEHVQAEYHETRPSSAVSYETEITTQVGGFSDSGGVVIPLRCVTFSVTLYKL
jgi:hypothetical protein